MLRDEIGTTDEPTSSSADIVTFSQLGASPDLRVLEVHGDLDISTSALLSQELDDLLDARIRHIDLDLSGVLFMDSSALSALVRGHEKAKRHGLRLTLVRPSPPCAKVLAITGLDRVFDLR